jgi:prophage regulatory protein
MKELPVRASGGVGVRIPDSRQSSALSASPGSVTAPRQDTVATRRSPRLLRFPAVRERTGLSRSTIWRLERRGEFPRHHRISPNVVAWIEEDVHRWIEARVG